MFPDSKITKSYKSARTKTRAIVNVLAEQARLETVTLVKEIHFSISTDGSNDKGSEQLYPILVRYHDKQKVVTDVLTIASPEGNSTRLGIFQSINKALTSAGLSWDNCISVGCDNASVMMGHLNGVAAHIKENSQIVIFRGVHVIFCI